MKADILVAEIGSTTTVVNAFTGVHDDDPVFWGQGQAPTSVTLHAIFRFRFTESSQLSYVISKNPVLRQDDQESSPC